MVFGGVNGGAEVGEDVGQVLGELRLGALEFLYLGQLVVEEAAYEAVEVGVARHVGAHGFLAVLDEDGAARIFEQDVVAGVSARELAPDFGVEVVGGVFGFPIPARHAEGVFDRPVGRDAGGGAQLRHEREILAMVAAVRRQAVLKRRANDELARGAGETGQLLEVGAVAVYVGVGGHGGVLVVSG